MADSSSCLIVCPSCSAINKVPPAKIRAKANCGKCHKPLMTGKVYDLNQNNFSRFIEKNQLPIIVDFWASWCGPCKMMAPVFEQVAMQMKEQVLFFKVNTEQEQMLSAQFQIKSIPTLILFKNGQEYNRKSGALDLNSLQYWAQSAL